MKKTILVILLIAFNLTFSQNQIKKNNESHIVPKGIMTMLGIKINDNKSSLQKIKLKIIARENNVIKYQTKNGNDFSVTTKNGKIVFMENDWSQLINGEKTLLTNFLFGKTSLTDIRKYFGTNGFVYKNRSYITTETEIIMFNCFEINSTNNEVLVVITKSPLDIEIDENNIGNYLKLDAIILSDKNYLEETWGKEKIYGKILKI